MVKQKSKILKELDPQEIEGFTKARIEHYLALGYRPFLCENGKVKWLTVAQMGMRDAYNKKSFFRSFVHKLVPHKKPKSKKRRRRSHLRSFLRANLIHIIIFLAVVIAGLLLVFLPYKYL